MFHLEISLLDRISDAFVALDREWRYVYVNRNAGELFGRDPKSLIGKHIWTEFPEGVGQKFHLAYEKAMETQVPIAIEEYYPLWSRWYENRIYPSPQGLAILFIDVTERKRAELELRRSEETFRALADHAPDIIARFDRQHRHVYINPAVEQITGIAADVFPGRTNEELGMPEAQASLWRQQLEQVFRTGEEQRLEFEWEAPGGRVWLQTRLAPELGSDGAVEFVLEFTRDITGQKEIEQALQRRERYFRALTENAQDVITTLGADGTILYESPAVVGVLGWDPSELVGRNAFDFVHPDDLEATRQQFLRLIQTASAVLRVEFRFRHAEGRWVTLESTGSNLLDDPAVGAVVVNSRDVTEQREAARRMAENEERLSLALAGANQGLWDWNVATGYCYLSPEFERLLGYSPGEIEPHIRTWEANAHPEDFERPSSVMNAHLEGGAADYRIEYRLRTKDGEWRWFEDRGRVVERDGEGRPLRVVGVIQDVTERKLTERQVHESEERFRSLVRATTSIVWTAAATGEVTGPLPEWEGFTGQSSEEIQGWGWLDAVHPDDQERTREAWSGAVERRAVYEIQHRLRRRDGEYRIMQARGVPLVNPNGTLREWVGTHTDVTAQMEAEAALRQSESRFRAIFDQAAVGIAVVGIDGVPIAVNPALRRMLGYHPERHAELTFRDVTHPEDVPAEEALLERLLRGEVSQIHLEKRYIRADGGITWGDVTCSVLRNDLGQPVAIVGIIQDITEQKRAEERLRESEERYRRFFEDDISGDYLADLEGRILACNEAFVRIFGFRSMEEALESRMGELHASREARDAILETVRTRGRVELLEFEMRRRDGKPIHVIKNVVGTFDDAGGLTGTWGYIVDITQHKQLEEQLRQAQKMEAVGKLAGGVAHDFNNMLTAIVGYGELLRSDGELTEQQRLCVGEILEAGRRSTDLTRQLLAFSRRQVLMPRAVDLNKIIRGMEGMLRRLIGEHINVRTDLWPALTDVFVDPGQAEQVMMNLAVNARDAMPDGGTILIQTSVAQVDPATAEPELHGLGPGRYALLTVSDTGRGMSEETREHIFEPFFTTKPVGEGTGLGLSTVFGILKQSGGAITVESEVGRGTTFRVYLPLAERNAAVAAESEAEPGPARGSETILLVEDDPAVRQLARRVLEIGGYTVLEAETGARAIQIAEEHPGLIRLLLTDVVIPGMSGRAVAEALRGSVPGIRVLFMSGYTDDAISRHGVLEPGTDFLQKPFGPDMLRAKVRQVLNGDP